MKKDVELVTILWLALFAAAAMGQPPKTTCEADLIRQTNPKNVDRYMDRGGRCEGLYAEQVSLTGNVLVASLPAGVVTPSAWTSQPFTVQCRYKERADIHIQAFLLQPRPFYRLDVVETGSAISWNWDTEVIAKYAKPVNVGLVAWTSAVVDGQTQRVYLPIHNPTASPGSPIKLIVVPPVAVSESYVTIAGTARGEKGSYLKNQRIEIDIPPLPHEGMDRVEVNCRSDAGSVSTPAFLIYSGGK